MSTIDLSAVCERHGITVLSQSGKAWMARYTADKLPLPVVWHSTKADAVCALLKARHKMTVRQEETQDGSGEWVAYMIGSNGLIACTRPTELAAVVALANRLTGRTGGVPR